MTDSVPFRPMLLLKRLARFCLRLVFWVFAAAALVSLLAIALVLLLLALLRALITGQRPAPARVFSRFQQFSAKGMPDFWPDKPGTARARVDDDNVLDVEVREISSDKPKT